MGYPIPIPHPEVSIQLGISLSFSQLQYQLLQPLLIFSSLPLFSCCLSSTLSFLEMFFSLLIININ